MKRSLLAAGLLVALMTGCGPADAGRMIRNPGNYKLKGDYASGLIVQPGTNGAQRLTIKTPTGSAVIDLNLREGWFVFVEAENRIWAYYGGEDLELATFEEKKSTYASINSSPELIPVMPASVFENLPASFRGKLEQRRPPASPK